MTTPTLPDADLLLMQAIRSLTAATVGTQVPSTLLDRLPFVMAVRFGGAAVDMRFLDRATVQVDVWDDNRKGASDTARTIRRGLYDCAANQTMFAAGYISSFREVAAPAEIRTEGQADNVWRFGATYSLFLRPPN